MSESLKREILELLDKDLEFRYAIAGYLGLSEILRRLDMLVEEQTKIWIEISKIWEEIKSLREEQAKLRQDMIEGFKRHDEILTKHSEEIRRLREDMMIGFKRHDEEIAKLRQDMVEGFSLLRRHLDALGSRWGLMAEDAFREGIRGLLEREFGFKIEKWVRYDESGMIFGYPSKVDIDVAIYDEKIILIEVKSRIDKEDVYYFRRKAEFYRALEGREPGKLIIVSPYVDEEALEVARRLGVEVYTKV